MTRPKGRRRPLVSRAVRRLAQARRNGEDGFALIFALLVVIIVAALSVTISSVVYHQVEPTQFAQKDIRTINAAEAGLQVSLGEIRDAQTTGGSGILTELPCTGGTGATFYSGSSKSTAAGATFTGSVSTVSGGAQYTTSIAYYLKDPTGQSLTWLQANTIACTVGSPTVVPGYAYIQTVGSGGSVPGQGTNEGDRTEHATYQFATTNVNVAGGRLLETGTSICLDAGSNPGVGTTLTMQPCLAIGTAEQTWQYRQDLSIFYGGNPTLDLCIQAQTAVGATPTLRTCWDPSGTQKPYNNGYPSTTAQQQEWAYNDSGHFAAVDTGDGNVTTEGAGGECLDGAITDVTNVALAVVTCDSNTDGTNAWNPDTSVGAGAAGGNTSGSPGAPTNQFVNYQEFGRCLDVTGQNVSASYLIAYPCKQVPDASLLTWNQVWTYTAVSGSYGTMSTASPSGQYCLTAPASSTFTTVGTTTFGYPTVTPCNTSNTSQLWQATGNLTGNYFGSYELVNDADGDCFGETNLGGLDPSGSSKIDVEACNGQLYQKWNAPANSATITVGNIGEDAGGSQ